MAKGRDTKKTNKKKSEKTLKEKRKEKRRKPKNDCQRLMLKMSNEVPGKSEIATREEN